MASTFSRFESSGFSPMGTPRDSCVCSPVDSEEALQHRLVDACQTIRNHPGVFQQMEWSVSRRALNIMEENLSTY
jgi:hypothetical protein